MAKILYFGTNGSENPTKSLVPFVGANASVKSGDEAMIHLFGDAVVLMKDVVVNSITPVGWPPLKETVATTIANKVPIYI
jgi:predicted peroxiredoxin